MSRSHSEITTKWTKLNENMFVNYIPKCHTPSFFKICSGIQNMHQSSFISSKINPLKLINTLTTGIFFLYI
jgi:hypothetical protein